MSQHNGIKQGRGWYIIFVFSKVMEAVSVFRWEQCHKKLMWNSYRWEMYASYFIYSIPSRAFLFRIFSFRLFPFRLFMFCMITFCMFPRIDTRGILKGIWKMNGWIFHTFNQGILNRMREIKIISLIV